MSTAHLLPSDALRGRRVGISVSQSEDLARLGLLESHFRVALGEITRAVLVSGGGIVYGGRLDPEGYTTFMVTELQRYARRDRPMLSCLAWHEHRVLPLSELDRFRQDLGLFGRLVCLDVEGEPVAMDHDRGEAGQRVNDQRTRQRALAGLRRFMSHEQRGRVFLGGRKRMFDGAFPGLIEEALASLRAGQPVYLAGGFGGMTLDIARALDADSADWLPTSDDALPDEPALVKGMNALRTFAASADYTGLNNGLSAVENRWLAASHRPADIASLVSLGLGRLGE